MAGVLDVMLMERRPAKNVVLAPWLEFQPRCQHHILRRPAFHQHHIQDAGHVAGMLRTGQQAVDQSGSPVWRCVLKEGKGRCGRPNSGLIT